MTAVVIIYILAEVKFALGRFIPYHIAVIVGLSITLLIGAFYFYKVIKKT